MIDLKIIKLSKNIKNNNSNNDASRYVYKMDYIFQ